MEVGSKKAVACQYTGNGERMTENYNTDMDRLDGGLHATCDVLR